MQLKVTRLEQESRLQGEQLEVYATEVRQKSEHYFALQRLKSKEVNHTPCFFLHALPHLQSHPTQLQWLT